MTSCQLWHKRTMCSEGMLIPGSEPAANASRTVETDHGAFVLLNCYVPNAGGAREGRPRAHFKLRFLQVH